MIYLDLDDDGYLCGLSTGADTTDKNAPPHISSIDGFDLSGIRMLAHKFDGEKLIFDEARFQQLQEQEKKAMAEWEIQEEKENALKEVQAALATAQINTLSVDDNTALRWRVLYPEWAPDTKYTIGVRSQYKDKLYRCLQEHTSQLGWEPNVVPALWTVIDETHSGMIDDPIPYDGNMALENGKYYTQDNVKYHCVRDTINPVYHALKDLVGLYVEVVQEA